MLTPQFLGSIKGDKFLVNSPRFFSAYCLGLKDGDYALEIHKVKGPPKTLAQLAYYYVAILPYIFEAIKKAGTEENEIMLIRIGDKVKKLPLTMDTVDYLLKETHAKFDGKNVTTKGDMSKEEARIFMDKCIRWAARYLSCVIPDAEDGTTTINKDDGLKRALDAKYKNSQPVTNRHGS